MEVLEGLLCRYDCVRVFLVFIVDVIFLFWFLEDILSTDEDI